MGDGGEVPGVGVGIRDLVAAVEGEAVGASEVVVGAGEGGLDEAVPGFGVGLEGGGVVGVGGTGTCGRSGVFKKLQVNDLRGC